MEQENLKKLKRDELLEIIVRQKKRIEELEDQVNKLEHADDQTLHLSFSEIGSWSDTLRKLAELFECGEKACASASKDNASAAPSRPVVHEEFDWQTQPRTESKAVPAEDASFIELDKIQWPSNR